MKIGIWLPVFGGWLRSRNDEGMTIDMNYMSAVAKKADRYGFHTMLVAELNYNDIKGAQEASLEAWTTAAMMAAVTDNIRIMAAIRPGFRHPSIVAKMAANIDHLSGGRFEINLVSGWWRKEMESLTGLWLEHSQRYQRSGEFIDVFKGLLSGEPTSYSGEFYQLKEAQINPTPSHYGREIPIYA